MRALIVLAIAVAVLHFGLQYVAASYGNDVKARFIEHGKYIPSIHAQNLPRNDGAYNLSNFTLWLASPENQPDRRGYVAPIIIPLDLLFLVALGSLLGLASVLLAAQMPFISKRSPAVWWLFPLAYLGCDLVEDLLIAAILTWPNLLNSTSFLLLRSFTLEKSERSASLSFKPASFLPAGSSRWRRQH